MALFLGEAVVLAMVGGALGLVALICVAVIVRLQFPEFPLSFSPLYWVLALMFSALIGLLAGVVPARNAARLDPIEALHTE